MIDFRKLCVLAVFAILPTVGLESGLAQDVDGDFLKIESNAEVYFAISQNALFNIVRI